MCPKETSSLKPKPGTRGPARRRVLNLAPTVYEGVCSLAGSHERRQAWKKSTLGRPHIKLRFLETDNAAMSLRIYEALAAIEQRRLSNLEIDVEEDRALEDAERGLLTLKAERRV